MTNLQGKNSKIQVSRFYRPFLFLFIPLILFSIFLGMKKMQYSQEIFPEELNPPFGLPSILWPKDNPYSKQKAELGRLLYFDKRLSSDGTISCASCHNIPCAYSDCKMLPIGIGHQQGTRHSPTIINAAYSRFLFWDGRATSLEEQAKGPLANTKEMSNVKDVHEAYKQCVNKIREVVGYRVLFKQVFGRDEMSIDDIARAIATFERTILSGGSPYDYYRAGNSKAMNREQIKGFEVYKKAGCIECHSGANFSDDRFINIGIGMDKENPDTGRYAITKDEKDWGAFKVPTLRDVEHSYPYMHDGSLATLEEVIDYYDRGGIPNKNLHPLIKPLHLSAEEKKHLLEFLKALNGTGWQSFQAPTEFPK